jgi:uroporphyrinogen-III decarboxylase
MMSANAKDRVYSTIDGGVPDRVPVAPKIWVDLGARLTGTPLLDVIRDPQTAMRVVVDAGRLCRADAVRLFHLPARSVRAEGDPARGGAVWELDGAGEVRGKIDLEGGLKTALSDPSLYDFRDPWFMAHDHFWTAESPVVRTLADADEIAVPTAGDLESFGWGARQDRVTADLGNDLAPIGDCSSATMAFLVSLRGMNQAMLDLIDEPTLVHRIMEKGVAVAVEKARFNLAHGAEILRLNDSVGTMSVMSPTHWREFVFPHMKEFCDEVHGMSPRARIYCHICGNVLPIVEDLVETGLDCIGPLDPLGGFTPRDVRMRVGEDIALMGGVNTLSLVHASPGEVREEARRCILEAGAHGGFILGSGCAVPRDARPENLPALREAADQFGRYDHGSLAGADTKH